MTNSTEPTIIIPAYCPDERLIQLVRELKDKAGWPVVVVDDGSGQCYYKIFSAVAQTGAVILTHRENRGKGAAIKTAIHYAKTHYPIAVGWVTADADGQHAVSDIVAVGRALQDNPRDLIMGTRDFSQKQVPFKSRWGNRITAAVFRLTTGTKCSDTQTGLRGIPTVMSDMLLATEGERFELEMNFLMNAAQDGETIRPVAIQTIYEKGNPTSNFNAVGDSLRVFSRIIKFACSSLSCAGIDLLGFTLLSLYCFGTTASGLFISTVAARLVSGSVNFFINQRWVFKGGGHWEEAAKYLALFLCQMGASGLLVSALSASTGYALAMKILVDSGLFILSYWIQKNFIFNQKRSLSHGRTTEKETIV